MDIREQCDGLQRILEDKKAEDIVILHVGDRTIIADYFIICNGRNTTHVKALCEELKEKYAEFGLDLRRTEGYNEGRWIVMDFANILVHIFHPEERCYYNMESLWQKNVE